MLTMSYQSSPYSTNIHEDYDDEDGYDDMDDYRDQEDPPPTMNDSDEDTEEASETDMGHHDEPLEIKEKMYQDKLSHLQLQIQQLREGAHPEFLRRVRRLEQQLAERRRLNSIQKEYLTECVQQDYILETAAAKREYEEKKLDLKENLLTDFEDKKKLIESERYSMELNGDSTEVKPALTRKLRRRPNEPAPVPDKRRKPTATQLTYQLEERDVDDDLRKIARARPAAALTAARKHHSPLRHNMGSSAMETRAPSPLSEARVESGKLLYERHWYHRGQSVFVESRDNPRFPAHITNIGTDYIWVKKATVDGIKLRIFTSQLSKGKFTIKRRAS